MPVGQAQKIDPAHNAARMRTNASEANSENAIFGSQATRANVVCTYAMVANGLNDISANAMHLNAVVANVGCARGSKAWPGGVGSLCNLFPFLKE